MGQIRIIGGTHRSRIIKFSDHVESLRPTPDRVRETTFNWLGQSIKAKVCLDLFAGSGALGFEAISRGAEAVVMIESNRSVYTNLVDNSKLLKTNNVQIKNQNALEFIDQSRQLFDIIFLDPPYDSAILQQCLDLLACKALIHSDTLIYIEYRCMPNLTAYSVIKEGRAGVVHFALIKR